MNKNFHPASSPGRVIVAPLESEKGVMKWVSAETLLKSKDIQPTNLWKPFFEHCGLAVLTGPSDTGKTRLARQLSIAIVQRQDNFLGFPLNVNHGRVYYVATEDNKAAVKKQLERESGDVWTPESMSNLFFLFDSENLVNELEDKLSFMKADMVVLDSWSDNFDGNANDFTSIRKDLKRLVSVAEKFGCLLVMIHHNTKNSEKFSPDKNRLNGSQALEAKPRVVLEFREGELENERLLTVVKHNYLPREKKEISYIISIEGDRVLLNNTGKTIGRKSFGQQGKSKYNSAMWINRFYEVRKDDQISIEKARMMLVKKYPNEDVPGSTWFKDNYKNVVSQSEEENVDRLAGDSLKENTIANGK